MKIERSLMFLTTNITEPDFDCLEILRSHLASFIIFILDDNYENATALIIIFRLNNYKSNKTFIDMAMAWEKKFLEFVEHYKSDNLTLHYLAEVCLLSLLVIIAKYGFTMNK